MSKSTKPRDPLSAEIWLQVLTLAVFMSPLASTANPADFTTYQDGDKLILTHYVGPGGAVGIPAEIGGRPVTGVHGNVFTGRSQMTSLNIPASIIELGDLNVGCMEGMTKGPLPDTGGIDVFQHCSNLAAITVDAANPNYASVDGVLFNKSLTTLIHYPNGKPGSYHIPANVRHIDRTAFDGSVGLTEITVDPANAFCSSRNGMLFNKDQTVLLKCPCGRSGSVTIPDGVTRIAESAFYGCKNVTDVEIPDSVTSIGDSAFLECRGLTRANLPNRLRDIEPSVFSGCTNLKDITLPDGISNVGRFAFISCENLGRVNIPSSVVSIGHMAFNGCKELATLSIPASVTTIENSAFGECDGLSGIHVDEANPSFKSVNGVLFNRDQTTMILCPAAFSGVCHIPATVTRLETGAFSTCANLTGFKVAESNPEFSDVDGVLFDHDRTTLLKFPRHKPGVYEIPGGVTTLGTNAFFKCAELSAVKIPAGVTHLAYGAFSHCAGLTELEIPASVKLIDEFVFYGCHGLASITIPAGISKISHCAFADCKGLTRVILPASLTEIGSSAFSRCAALTTIEIPDHVTTLGDCAFNNCANLTRIQIPAKVARIEMQAFLNCSKMKAAMFAGNAPTIGLNVFKYTAPGFKVYYLTGNAGFTSPAWQNITAEGVAKLQDVVQ